MTVTYTGADNYQIRLDSGTSVEMSITELEQLSEQVTKIKNSTTNGNTSLDADIQIGGIEC